MSRTVFADDVDPLDPFAADRRLIAISEDLECTATWSVTNAGPLPVDVRRFGFPLGGPGTGFPYRLDGAAVGGAARPLAPARGSDRDSRPEHVLEVGVVDVERLAAGESVDVTFRVVAGKGCASVGSATAMVPSVRSGLGPFLVHERPHSGAVESHFSLEPAIAFANVDSEWASCDAD
ncbi:hypothetical protein [Aquipuribacter nitratireducens]|uniref:Uncharacterized protein n=1 Tax=Aquipuribacter nitratireducens TaxID=650104 RepID=A0ABW0GNT9_9MICO